MPSIGSPMPSPARKWFLRYGVAAAAVGLATASRFGLDPLMAGRQRYTPFYVAVMATCWFAGLGPSILAVALACLSVVFISPSPGTFRFDSLSDTLSKAMFVAFC